MRILGIDPGSSATGFGVVERRDGRLVHVAHGTLRPPRGAPLARRLHFLHGALRAVVAQHRPDVAAVEQVFVASSPRAALVLGQARGAVLSALGSDGLPVVEYSASQIKLGVTGSGRADKRQVQGMVGRLLGLACSPAPDAADALAAAIRHAHGGRLEALGVPAARRSRPRRPGAAFVAVRRLP
jgi:crossover junction endodeoxyribonuclease RuvC